MREEEKCNISRYAIQSKKALIKIAASESNLEKSISNMSSKENKEI